MEANKKEDTSSESSSGSTSDSSTSSSSSSGSESSSSSDSDSSSSQASTRVLDTKKAAPVHKNVKRNSDTTKQPQANIKQDAKPPTKQKPVLPKSSKPTVEIEISSSDDEDTNKSNSVSKHSTKKKTINKPKPAGNINKPASSRPPSSKVTPKSQQSSGKSVVKTNESSKNSQSKNTSSKVLDKDDPNKKKSIFSPENSSEDSESTAKGKLTQKSPSKTSKRSPRKTEQQNIKKSQNSQKSKTESNTVSSEDGSSSDSSSSDSDSSGPSVKRFKKDDSKPKSSKQNQNSNSDSDNDTTDCKKTLRKSTRSANTRKSKHVLGKNVYSDTDSDTESTKRSSTQSPVKKAPSSSKGKAKKKSENIENMENKSKGNDILVEERTCPLDSCNSLGHISGKFPKHFTLEACPIYHNKTVNQCKEEGIERKKREENRKKVLEIFKKAPKTTILQEQKQNLQKIREARAKFEYVPPDVPKITDNSREPIIDGFVPDYDLQLFKDAQAIAAEKIEEDLKTQPHTKGTKFIEMGKYEMEVWYQSPYPEDYTRLPKLYICEFCLRYMKSRTVLLRHIVKCVWRHPPGEEVYRKDKISVWEVDGKKYKQYCQNLCLLAKFFLDHKTLYYDVEPFLFYVMTIYDTEGCHTVGYFSKEKNSFLNYNVSCILTLPPYQRQGYGRLLIDFSYLLTRVEGKIGSPEKPLSDLGLISYRSYWKDVLLGYLCANSNPALSVKDISQEMAISSYDIVSTLQALGMMKYWKGKHIILKKQDVIDEYVERTKRRSTALKEVDRACLRWNPIQPASV